MLKELLTLQYFESQAGTTYFDGGIFLLRISRKASIANSLKALCEKQGLGLNFMKVDILLGGKAHDLMDKAAQEA